MERGAKDRERIQRKVGREERSEKKDKGKGITPYAKLLFISRLDCFSPFLLSILYVQLFAVEVFCEDGERGEFLEKWKILQLLIMASLQKTPIPEGN